MANRDESENGQQWYWQKMLGAAALFGAGGMAGCTGAGDGTPAETGALPRGAPTTPTDSRTSEHTADTDSNDGGDGGTWDVDEFVDQPACTPPEDEEMDFLQFAHLQDVYLNFDFRVTTLPSLHRRSPGTDATSNSPTWLPMAVRTATPSTGSIADVSGASATSR